MKESERLIKLLQKNNRFFIMPQVESESYIFDCWNCSLYLIPPSIKVKERNEIYFETEDIKSILFLFDITDKIIDFSKIREFNNKYNITEKKLNEILIKDYSDFISSKGRSDLFTKIDIEYKYYFHRILEKKLSINKHPECLNCKWKYLCVNNNMQSCSNVENNFYNTLKIIIRLCKEKNKSILFEKLINQLNK